jgi:hypothetical protein
MCRNAADQLARDISFCMYLTGFSTDFIHLFCFLWNGVSYFCPCSLINGATSHHEDIFGLLPFLEHLVQPTLWCGMVWSLLLSGWIITQGSIMCYYTMHYFLYYIKQLKYCWPWVSDCNLPQYIHSLPLLYRLMDHSKVLILLMAPWYVCGYCH